MNVYTWSTKSSMVQPPLWSSMCSGQVKGDALPQGNVHSKRQDLGNTKRVNLSLPQGSLVHVPSSRKGVRRDNQKQTA